MASLCLGIYKLYRFVKHVLRKDPKKVKEGEPSYIAGKWSSW